MIPHRRFPVEPWAVREVGLDLDVLAQSESLFALSNGHIGLRGNLDEGDPAGLHGTYLNSFYEVRPLPYAEAGYGFPETGQTVVNVTDGKLIRMLVDDEPFDLRYGEVRHHERVLDLRAGVLRREAEWVSPAGQCIKVRSTRLVSLTQRSIMAVHYEVEAVDQPARVVVLSELVANENVATRKRDPRVAAILKNPLEAVEHDGDKNRAYLIHRTRESRLLMAVAMDHIFHSEHLRGTELSVHPDWARVTAGAVLQPGSTLSMTKFVAYGWSSQRSVPALRDQVHAAMVAAHGSGWQQLIDDQRAALDQFWAGADVEIDGDDAIQQAVRFALFHTYQAAARAEVRAIPAKGLTGPGYDGHAFWDTESFVLPVLTAVAPKAAADAIHWRAAILDMARDRARSLTLRGAAFPWRTIRGQECSGYWPAGTAAVHVNADIAVAAIRYVRWTQDLDFERNVALPILVETARLWMSLGYHGADALFHIDGVTGPDEYSAIVDDNIYTNLMAKQNLDGAADAAERAPDEAAGLEVTSDEIAAWRAAASVMAVPYDEKRQVHQQDKGFTDHEWWDFAGSAAENAYPLLLNAPYFDIYRKQVVKQADLILAMHWAGDEFTIDEKARAFAYYEPLTVRDSSLSSCTQAVIAAEVGQLDLATDYLAEAALVDLDDLHGNTADGVHIASLAGTWIALVAGFGGMRDHGDRLSFHPQLPDHWRSLTFRVRWREALLRVRVTRDGVTYELTGDDVDELELVDCGEPVVVRRGQPLTRSFCPVEPLTDRPHQPPSREPLPASALLAYMVPPDDRMEGHIDPDPVEG
ncbi:MAG TPA: glycosyl hydrolase family 65 protein [Jatrophihabitantaceae bacterium]|nr:glycosyl hydrolase family 65 protein [Jatrophihabitantaceae bacterium]